MLEKKYSYLYNPLAMYKNPLMRLQTERYALETTTSGAVGLTRLGFVKTSANFRKVNFEEIAAVTSAVSLETEGGRILCDRLEECYTAPQWYWCALNCYRIIEAGRYSNKFDMMYLRFGDTPVKGRLEIAALPTGFTFMLDCITDAETSPLSLRYELNFAECTPKVVPGGVELDYQKGSIFISALEGTTVSVEGGRVVLKSEKFTPSRTFKGLAARFSLDRMPGAEKEAKVTFFADYPAATQLQYDNVRGVYEFILPEEEWHFDYNDPEERNIYDRITFTVENPTDEELTVPLCFRKDGFRVSITGMSPMLADAETGEPSGEHMQVTKDWHIHPDKKETTEWFACAADDPRRLYEGKWTRFYALVTVPPKGKFSRRYICAYENWGKYCAVSHSQLSLIGWGGYHIWEQTAFGSHGENICYQLDQTSRGGSVIGDIRPLYTIGAHGGFRRYDWSGNIGGGEFLNYKKGGEKYDLCDSFIDFVAQCPVLAETRYKLLSEDGKIALSLTTSEGRTNDVTRIYFKMRYDILDNITYDRLDYFNYPSTRYEKKLFRKFSFGEGKRVIDSFSLEKIRKKLLAVAGSEPWFFFYGAPRSTDVDFRDLSDGDRALAANQNSDCLITVRRFEESVDGHIYSLPQAVVQREGHNNIFAISGNGNGKMYAGDYAELTVELVVVPQKAGDYYGENRYFRSMTAEFDTPGIAAYLSANNSVSVDMAQGKLLSTYPVVVTAENDEATFRIRGGLGLVNVRVEGFSDYRGIRFLKNGRPFDHSVKGKDFWQVDRNEEGGYNVSVSLINDGDSNLYTICLENIRKDK